MKERRKGGRKGGRKEAGREKKTRRGPPHFLVRL